MQRVSGAAVGVPALKIATKVLLIFELLSSIGKIKLVFFYQIYVKKSKIMVAFRGNKIYFAYFCEKGSLSETIPDRDLFFYFRKVSLNL